MVRSILAVLALLLALPAAAAGQSHALTASATVLSPVRVDVTPEVAASADGGALLRAPESGSTRHVVTMSVAPAGGAEEALAALRGRREKEVDLREEAAGGRTRLRVTYVVAVIA